MLESDFSFMRPKIQKNKELNCFPIRGEKIRSQIRKGKFFKKNFYENRNQEIDPNYVSKTQN